MKLKALLRLTARTASHWASHLEHQSVFGDTCVVNQDVYSSEFLHYLCHCIVSLLEVSGVGRDCQNLYAIGFEFFLCLLSQFINNEVCKSYVCSFGGKLEGNCLADSSRCSCNQGNLSFE